MASGCGKVLGPGQGLEKGSLGPGKGKFQEERGLATGRGVRAQDVESEKFTPRCAPPNHGTRADSSLSEFLFSS